MSIWLKKMSSSVFRSRHPGDAAEVVWSLSPVWCECAVWWIQVGKLGKPAGYSLKGFFWTTALTEWKMWFSVVLLLLYRCELKRTLTPSGFEHCVLQQVPVFVGRLSWSIIYMFKLALTPTCISVADTDKKAVPIVNCIDVCSNQCTNRVQQRAVSVWDGVEPSSTGPCRSCPNSLRRLELMIDELHLSIFSVEELGVIGWDEYP